MMNDQEREAAHLAMEALDHALLALGREPVAVNPDFRMATPVVGDLPNAVLEKSGVAPLRFIFGLDLDVWVGPFSEIVTSKVSEVTKTQVQHKIEDLLRSSVALQQTKRSVEITLRLPGMDPWLRLKVRALGLTSILEPTYDPYIQ